MLAGKVGIWDTSTGQCKHMLEGPGGTIEWAQWHPKGDVILAGSDDFTAWLWNAQNGTCMQVRCAASHIHLLKAAGTVGGKRGLLVTDPADPGRTQHR